MLAPLQQRNYATKIIQFSSEEELIDELKYKQSSCYDTHVDPKFIELVKREDAPAEYVRNLGGGKQLPIDFTSSAMTQLLGRLGMSVRQYNRSPDWLKVHNFNYFRKHYGKDLKFRMRDENITRAVLSSTYGVMDDVVAFPAIFKGLRDREDVGIRGLEYDNYITRLYLEFSSANITHNEHNYTAGLVITNSETGHSSIWIEPVVYNNSYLWIHRNTLRKQGVDCRIIHKGTIDLDRVKNMVEQNAKIAQVGIIQLEEAHSEQIPVKEVFKYIRDTPELPSRWEALIVDHVGEDEFIARAEAAKELLQLAASLPLFQRSKVEQAAGSFIGIFDHFEERMLSIMQDLD